VVNDDGVTDETDASTKTTSIEYDIGTMHPSGSYPREKPNTLGCVDAPNFPESATEPLGEQTSPGVALPQHPRARVVREDDRGAGGIAGPSTAITSPRP